MGEVTKTERVFISPHFCLENLPSKFLPCKLTLWGEEVKMLASFYLPPNGLFGFLPTFYPQKASILTEVVGEDKKTLTIFSSLTKILWSFFHKTASQGLFRCFLPLPRPRPQPPRHAPVNAKKAARFLLPPSGHPVIPCRTSFSGHPTSKASPAWVAQCDILF